MVDLGANRGAHITVKPRGTVVVSTSRAPLHLERGTRGPTGTPGPTYAGYTFRQTTPAAQWVINHGLGRRLTPTLVVDELPAQPVFTDVTFLPEDPNVVIVTWPQPEAGYAYF